MPESRECRLPEAACRNAGNRRNARRFLKGPPRSALPRASCARRGLARFLAFERRPDLNRQTDEVDEPARVFLIVARAHSETGDIERVERIRRLTAHGIEVS